MRAGLLLLGLAVCFLIGVLYGVERESGADGDTIGERETVIEVIQEEEEVTEEPVFENKEAAGAIQSDTTPAYKAASALESVVKFFYEIIVEILFQVSKLFY